MFHKPYITIKSTFLCKFIKLNREVDSLSVKMSQMKKVGILTGLILIVMFSASAYAVNFAFYEAPASSGYNPWNHAGNTGTRSTWLTAVGETPDYYANFEGTGWYHGRSFSGINFGGGTSFYNVGGSSAYSSNGGGCDLGCASPIGSFSWRGNQNAISKIDFGTPSDYLGFYIFDIDHGQPVTYKLYFTDGTSETQIGKGTGDGSWYRFVGFINTHGSAKFSSFEVIAPSHSRYGIDELEWGVTTTTTTTTSSTSTTKGNPSEEIPEFPTAAAPVLISAAGYLVLRRRRNRD